MTDFNLSFSLGGVEFWVDEKTLIRELKRHTKKQTVGNRVLQKPLGFTTNTDRFFVFRCRMYRGETTANKATFVTDKTTFRNLADGKPYTLSTGSADFNGTFVIIGLPTEIHDRDNDKMIDFNLTLREW